MPSFIVHGVDFTNLDRRNRVCDDLLGMGIYIGCTYGVHRLRFCGFWNSFPTEANFEFLRLEWELNDAFGVFVEHSETKGPFQYFANEILRKTEHRFEYIG